MNDWFEAEQRVERAHELFESGRWEDALHELRAAVHVNPFQGEWHFNMGLALDALGRYDEAIASFTRAMECDGEDAEVLNNLGVDHLRLDRATEALEFFERAGRLEPSDVASYIHRIAAYAQLDDHDQAEVMFYMAQELDDAHPRAYYEMGLSLLDRSMVDRAIWCLNQVRRLDPNAGDVHARLGEAHWLKGQLERARRHYLRQLRVDGGDVQTLMELAMLLVEMDRSAEAAQKLRRVTELDPGHIEAHFELAMLAMDNHDLDAAQRQLQLVLRLDAQRPGVHQKLARIALERKRMIETRRHLRAELAIERDFAESEEADELAELLLDAQMPREAVRLLAAMSQSRPQDAAVLHQYALALFMDNRLEPGIRVCRQALRLDPACTAAMHNLTLAHLQLGQYRRARYWLKQVLRQGEAGDAQLRQLQTKVLWATLKQAARRIFRRK